MKWAFKQTAAQRTRFLKRACSGVHVEWQRVQFPLVPALPKTLHGLQGITADPGLIAHFRVPNVSAETKRLAYYVMLSRVRSLDNLLCHGLPEREILEGGPPETLRRAMDELFEGKIATTFESCEKARAELGWPEKKLLRMERLFEIAT